MYTHINIYIYVHTYIYIYNHKYIYIYIVVYILSSKEPLICVMRVLFLDLGDLGDQDPSAPRLCGKKMYMYRMII